MAYKEFGDLQGVSVLGTVIKVLDGDSVHIVAPVGESGGSYLVKCRLDGIDTPPLANNKSARALLESIIAESGGMVLCIFGKREKFGRALVTLYNNWDTSKPSINQRMLDSGEAKEYHGGKKEW